MKRRKPSTVGRTGLRNELGARGETLAADFLLQNGYEILERNWQGWWGEIDIVARKGDTVFMVEVKVVNGPGDMMRNSLGLKRFQHHRKLQMLENEYPDYFIEGKLLEVSIGK